MKPIVAAILILTASCTKDINYTQQVCEELSMKAYRGLPKPAKKFKDNCGSFNVKYSSDLCQKALEALMLYGNEKYLKSNFGDKIMGCFNKGDLDRFLKNKSN